MNPDNLQQNWFDLVQFIGNPRALYTCDQDRAARLHVAKLNIGPILNRNNLCHLNGGLLRGPGSS